MLLNSKTFVIVNIKILQKPKKKQFRFRIFSIMEAL